MISRLRGTVAGVADGKIEVATPGGVVYEVDVPLPVLERLPAPGGDVELRTVQVVREDGMVLFGFLDAGERLLFQRLLATTGVGGRLALSLLSTYPGPRLVRVLQERDVAALVQVSGVGKKTAERLVVELSDRMSDLVDANALPGRTEAGPAQAAVQALLALGLPFAQADRAVRSVMEDGVMELDEIVRKALARE